MFNRKEKNSQIPTPLLFFFLQVSLIDNEKLYQREKTTKDKTRQGKARNFISLRINKNLFRGFTRQQSRNNFIFAIIVIIRMFIVVVLRIIIILILSKNKYSLNVI